MGLCAKRQSTAKQSIRIFGVVSPLSKCKRLRWLIISRTNLFHLVPYIISICHLDERTHLWQPKGAERAEFQMSQRAFYKSGIAVTLGRGISSARVSVLDFLVHPDSLLFFFKKGPHCCCHCCVSISLKFSKKIACGEWW